MKTDFTVIELPGLDGSNPLAFLAALGVIRASDILYSGKAALSWNETTLRPALKTNHASLSIEKLCEDFAGLVFSVATQELSRSSYDSPVIKIDRNAFQHFAAEAVALTLRTLDRRNGLRAAFVAAFGSDGIADKNDNAFIAPSRLSHANNQGGKVLLDGFRQLAATHKSGSVDPIENLPKKATKRKKQIDESVPSLATLIREALTSWSRRPNYPGFRWEPDELRQAAYMARNPNDEPLQFVPGANALAVLGLTMLPTVPTVKGLATSCAIALERRSYFVWPLWQSFLGCDIVNSLLLHAGNSDGRVVCPRWNEEIGVFSRFAAERYTDPKQNVYFCPSVEL